MSTYLAPDFTGWFGRKGVAMLAASQQKMPGGLTATTKTCIAAYKQFDDIELLLQLVESDKEHMEPAILNKVLKIQERHEKYRTMQETEVIPERT